MGGNNNIFQQTERGVIQEEKNWSDLDVCSELFGVNQPNVKIRPKTTKF